MSEVKVKKSDKFTMFVPAFIDDYGFNPEEFRVFSRIMRRSLGSGDGCFESIPNMAKSLKMAEAIVRRALNVLVRCKAITHTPRKGKPAVLEFQTCDNWLPAENLEAIRSELEMRAKEKDRERKTRIGNDTGVVTEMTRVPVSEMTDEGIPLKEAPSKVLPFSTKTGETPFPKEKDLPPKAEEHNLAAATIWRIGVGLLIDQGIPEPQARSLLGKYAKEFGKEAVAGVIGRMSADPPVNCVTYLAKVFATKEVKKNPTNRELIRREQEWILQDNATTVH